MTSGGWRATITVSGRVQGVGFRQWTAGEVRALRLPITGTVRNLPDGCVEVVAESADRAALDILIGRLSVGPGTAHVDAVHPLFEVGVAARHPDFRVTY